MKHVRQILFRGDRVDGCGWVEGDLLMVAGVPYIHPLENELSIVGHKATLAAVYEVVPNSVGQFTGRRDKNGVRIWEGDWVRGRFYMGWEVQAEMRYDGGTFGLEWLNDKGRQFVPFASLCSIEVEKD